MVRIDFDQNWFRWAAKIEDESDCDISAGLDYGQNLSKYLEMVMSDQKSISRESFVQVLHDQFGSALSQKEIEKLAQDFQLRVIEAITNKSKAA
jgi:hypothetical protein